MTGWLAGLLAAGALWFVLGVPLVGEQDTGRTVRHHPVNEQDPEAARLAAAETDIDKGDYRSAESLLKEFLKSHADSYSAWYDLGFVEHALGRQEESVAAYRRSVEAKPNVFESNLNLGLVLAEQGRPEAEQFLRSATKLSPVDASGQGHKRAWMGLGGFLERTRPEEAVTAYQQAASLDPTDPEPHLAAGSLLEKLERLSDAENEYRQALKIQPESADALAALSNLWMRQKQFKEAEVALGQLAKLRPQDAAVHLELGRVLAISGKKEEAARELEAGVNLDPQDRQAQRDLADLYGESGNYERAEALYRTLLTSEPNNSGLHQGLGRLLLKQKKFPQAEQELMKAVELKPDAGEVYGDLAVAANENKDYPLAIKAADLRGKYLPETAMSYFLRATAYDHLRDMKQAAKYYHQFLDTAGRDYPDQQWQAKHRLIAIEPKK